MSPLRTFLDGFTDNQDLALACGRTDRESWVVTREFMDAIEKRLKQNLAARL